MQKIDITNDKYIRMYVCMRMTHAYMCTYIKTKLIADTNNLRLYFIIR